MCNTITIIASDYWESSSDSGKSGTTITLDSSSDVTITIEPVETWIICSTGDDIDLDELLYVQAPQVHDHPVSAMWAHVAEQGKPRPRNKDPTHR